VLQQHTSLPVKCRGTNSCFCETEGTSQWVLDREMRRGECAEELKRSLQDSTISCTIAALYVISTCRRLC